MTLRWHGNCVRPGCEDKAAPREIVCRVHMMERPENLTKPYRHQAFRIHNIPWSPQEESNLRRWVLDEHRSMAEIIKLSGRTESSIKGKMQRMGLHWPKGARTPFWVKRRMERV